MRVACLAVHGAGSLVVDEQVQAHAELAENKHSHLFQNLSAACRQVLP